MVNHYIVKCFLLISILITVSSCRSKYHNVSFLNPLERNIEGFVDIDTYQVISEASVFDLSNYSDNLNKYIPISAKSFFSQKDLDRYNEELFPAKKKKKKILKNLGEKERPFSIKELLDLEMSSLPLEKLQIGRIDHRLQEALQLKKKLIDSSCETALVRALYRWYVLIAPDTISRKYRGFDSQLVAGKSRKDIIKKLKHKDDETESTTLPLLTNFSATLFPPHFFVDGERFKVQKEELKRFMHEDDFSYEVIAEVVSDPSYLACKVVIYIKQSNIVENYALLTK